MSAGDLERGRLIPRGIPEEGSPSLAAQFQSFVELDFIPRQKRDEYSNFQYRVEGDFLFVAESYDTTDAENKRVKHVKRHYFATEADKFVECASIGFHRSVDRSGYVLRNLLKKPEGNGDYVFIGFTGENMDVYISSPVMFLTIRTEGEVVDSFASNIDISDFEGNYEQEESEVFVSDLKESPWNIRSVDSDLDFKYDHTSDCVVITVSQNGEKKRVMRMGVGINIRDIKERLFPLFCLDDPYNTYPSDDDWIHKDLVKEIGVVDI